MNPGEESRKRRNYDAFQSSRDKSISPPPKRHASSVSGRPAIAENDHADNLLNAAAPSTSSSNNADHPSKSITEPTKPQSSTLIRSPMQLNFVGELPASSNADCISLGGLLGDPMIKECWLFNYLFDVDFVM